MGEDGKKRSRRRRTSGTSRLRLALATEGPAWSCLDDDPAVMARQVARAVDRNVALPASSCTATVMLSDDAHVRLLNRQWRGLDKPTNVLSFPSASSPAPAPSRRGARRAPPACHIGDLILAEETLAREAVSLGIPARDHFRHLVLHGLLHILGYDHDSDDEAEEMEALETRLLATLGVADPYTDSEPVTRSATRQAAMKPGGPSR